MQNYGSDYDMNWIAANKEIAMERYEDELNKEDNTIGEGKTTEEKTEKPTEEEGATTETKTEKPTEEGTTTEAKTEKPTDDGITTTENKVVSIDKNSCYGCSGLKTVLIGDNVTYVGSRAFASCSKLETISFGKGIIRLSSQVLDGDKKLSKITFKSTKIRSFGKNTFRNVPRKVDIVIPSKRIKKYVKLVKKAK